MEDLNELSNDELQYRLAQFGVPTFPVTATTRKVLVKRLRILIDTEKNKLRRDTDNVTRYSSDEDVETKPASKSRARSTISAKSSTTSMHRGRSHMPPPTLASTSSISKAQPQKKANTSNVYISSLIQHDTDEGSESDSLNASISSNRYRNNLSMSRSSASSSNSRLYNGHDATNNSIGLVQYSNDSHDGSTPGNSFLHASTESNTNGDQESDDLLNTSSKFTKRLLSLRTRSLAGATMNPPAMIGSSKPYDRYSTSPLLNFQSNYPSDLSTTRRSLYPRTSSIAYQAANVEKPSRPFSVRQIFSDLWNRQYERYSMKQSLVPCILLSALFLFFTSVIIAYITMNPDLSLALDSQAATFKECPAESERESTPPSSFQYQPTVNCIVQDQINSAFSLLKMVIPELQRRIVHNRCADPSAPFAMSASEVMGYIFQQSKAYEFSDIKQALHNAEYLISLNPQWRVGHFIDGSGQPSASISMANLVRARPTQSNYLAIVNPHLPVSCYLYNKLQAVFAIIGWIAIVALIVLALVFVVRYIRNHVQTKRQRVTNMYEAIKSILMEKAFDPDTAQTEQSFVVVEHLRDKLIPPSERSRMESVWKAAMKNIENDSRIQLVCGIRNGEEYRMLRWADSADDFITPTGENSQLAQSLPARYYTNANASTNNCSMASSTTAQRTSTQYNHNNVKKWQSPAFDKSNKIKDPPTECLKIRQMFDKYEASNSNLKQIIQDSILEKVAHTTCRIYDLQLDKQTCCVYVRCASAKDAGIIHDEVNGWWFDRRLVSIKFLRLDRYLARFPNASSGPACVKLSNTKNLSMTNGDDDPSTSRQNGKRSADNLDDLDEDDDDLEHEIDTRRI